MLRIRSRTVLAALWCVAVLCAGTAVNAAAESSAKWGAVLRSSASTFEKATACRRLAIVGDRDAVAALVELLADRQLAAHARTALEIIPAAEAVDALHAALPRLDGALLVGAIGSVGKRRDPRSLETLTTLLGHHEPLVVGAAARALGEIGTAAAADALTHALAGGRCAQRAALAIGCLICVNGLCNKGKGRVRRRFATWSARPTCRSRLRWRPHRRRDCGAGARRSAVVDRRVGEFRRREVPACLASGTGVGRRGRRALTARVEKDPPRGGCC